MAGARQGRAAGSTIQDADRLQVASAECHTNEAEEKIMQCPECKGYRHDGPCEVVSLYTARRNYLAAFDALMAYTEKHPPMWRKPEQDKEFERLEAKCTLAKMAYERVKLEVVE